MKLPILFILFQHPKCKFSHETEQGEHSWKSAHILASGIKLQTFTASDAAGAIGTLIHPEQEMKERRILR